MILKSLRPLVTRGRFAAVTDTAGIGCLVGAGWHFNATLGIALTGVALLLVGLVVNTDEPSPQGS